MRRLLIGVALLLTLLAALEVGAQGTGMTRLISTRIYPCSTGVTLLTASNPNRVYLTLTNVGTIHVGLSGQEHATTQLLANGFFTLHAGASIEFANFAGGLLCTAAGPVNINVLEEIR